MPTFRHSWTSQHFPQDYAQTMVLAKLLAGCPISQDHRCTECTRSMDRQVKLLFKATRTIIDMPADAQETYARVIAKQHAHRKFLQLWDMTKGKQRIWWYAKYAGVTRWIVKQWMDVEQQSRKRQQV